MMKVLKKSGFIPYTISDDKMLKIAYDSKTPVVKVFQIYHVYRYFSRGSNYLSMKSYMEMYCHLNPNHVAYAPEAAKMIYNVYDRDKDGYISFYEFYASIISHNSQFPMPPLPPPPPPPPVPPMHKAPSSYATCISGSSMPVSYAPCLQPPFAVPMQVPYQVPYARPVQTQLQI